MAAMRAMSLNPRLKELLGFRLKVQGGGSRIPRFTVHDLPSRVLSAPDVMQTDDLEMQAKLNKSKCSSQISRSHTCQPYDQVSSQ